jgi:peptide-methionine (R)-S-oxide reductase
MAKSDQIKVPKDDAEWREALSDEEYRVMRNAGTEAPFSGQYNVHFKEGVYHCKGCGTPLFTSASKFDGHCGWPSFDAEIEAGTIRENRDVTHGMIRTEIVCAKCDSHLGHVFPDGPTATGLRYCVNSVSLGFIGEDDS